MGQASLIEKKKHFSSPNIFFSYFQVKFKNRPKRLKNKTWTKGRRRKKIAKKLLCNKKKLRKTVFFIVFSIFARNPKMAKLTREKVSSCLKGSALTLATLIGVIGGVIFGLCLRQRERKIPIVFLY